MKNLLPWAWYRYTLLFAASLFLGMSVSAQVNTASLSGLVTDPSGATIPAVTVSVTSPATGYARTVTTDNAGYYSFQNLPIGLCRASNELKARGRSRRVLVGLRRRM